MPAVRFEHVNRHFGEVRAVDDVSFAIADGEFFSLLGPSGSGKTTSLRLIAGFEQPDSGVIEIHGQSVAGVPPYERDVNTVFQDYALFPHMSVLDNVSYGLMVRKVPKAARLARAEAMLDLVKLGGLGSRRPAALSGGQRQRVALARALVNRPRVLLLDEPLGALDLKLREQMRSELKALQRQVGITFVYVTHDQEEALSMSDRLAVLNHGRIEQIGAPQQVYEHPRTAFVAGFVGVSNLIEGALAERLTGGQGAFTLRPEKIRIDVTDVAAAALAAGHASVAGTIAEVQYLGASSRYEVALDGGGTLSVVFPNSATGVGGAALDRGRAVRLSWPRSAAQAIADGAGQ